jgi:tetratricopeptide (TPR) repeat protein
MAMRSVPHLVLLGLLAAILAAGPAGAVMSGGGDTPPAAAAGSDEYAAGLAAFDHQDWQGVIDHMARVIEDRPWEDEAYNLSGFAYRKLGDYNQALKFYDQALKLNPHNRGALEYLGEAYLEMDRPKDAQAMLDRLNEECRRLAANSNGRPPDCQEREDLEEALAVYRAGKS